MNNEFRQQSNFMASRIQKSLLNAINLIIEYYYSLRKGNQIKFSLAVNCL